MTKDTNKENVLKVIRYIQSNVEGLKELGEGCKVEIASCPDGCCGIDIWVIDSAMQIQAMTISHQVFKDKFYITEIIGHEVQLNHLLLAIYRTDYKASNLKDASVDMYFNLKFTTIDNQEFNFEYKLTQTVQENLESNPELTNYCLTLFGL